MIISKDRGFCQWPREAIEIEKYMFVNLSINRDMENLNIDTVFNIGGGFICF